MYKFVDTTSNAGKIRRPAEAMRINGTYLEDEIPGYQTLSVSGRESLEAEVKVRDNTSASGSLYLSRRYPSRTITVRYRIAAKTNHEFREAFNKMNRILDAQQAKIIFDDEPDKYFIGTKTGGEAPEAGRNFVTGSFDIFCADPFKYSVAEKPVAMGTTGKSNTRKFVFKNDGAVAVPARYEITLFNESGYIGLASSLGAMEFGNRTEADTVAVKVDQPLRTFDDLTTGADAGSHHGVKKAKFKTTGTAKSTRNWLTLDWGSGVGNHPTTGWCHSQKTWLVPNSTDGAVKDFTVSGRAWFECADASQIGEQIIECLGDKDGKEVRIARLTISKGSTDFSASCHLYVNGEDKKQFSFTPNNKSLFATGEKGAFSIAKKGSTVTIKISGAPQTLSCKVPGFDGVKLTKVRSYFGHQPYTASLVTRMYFGDLKVTANGVNGRKDQRNAFFPGKDGLKLTIDGKTSKFYYGSTYRPDMEILGSQWFLIPPGTHTVELVLSSWFKKKVTGTAYIREAWL